MRCTKMLSIQKIQDLSILFPADNANKEALATPYYKYEESTVPDCKLHVYM